MKLRTFIPRTFLRRFGCSLVIFSVLFSGTTTATRLVPDTQGQFAQHKPRIQLAILLDTSNSMDGLIDQARNQLWQVVDEFSKSKKSGVVPILEVAVYEYGNSRLSVNDGYVRQVVGLSSELDSVSEALFSLTTNGGSEYCGYVIDRASRQLNWSQSDNDIKAIFIAGNEPFTQGPIAFDHAIELAKSKGITVNTIHAGDYNTGVTSGWQQGALMASGNYMSIDHNHQVVHIVAPQDNKIAELNQKLNQTYLAYGKDGQRGMARQKEQDSKSNDISLGLLAKRVKAKVSSMYKNTKWDLVDAVESDKVKLDEIKRENLPKPMQSMDIEAQRQFLKEKKREREDIKKQIAELSEARDSYVASEKSKMAEENVSTIDDALVSAVRSEGEKKNFNFEK